MLLECTLYFPLPTKSGFHMSRLRAAAANVGLVAGSLMLTLVATEGVLRLYAAWQGADGAPPRIAIPAPAAADADIVVPADIVAAARSRHALISMPESWARTAAHVDGALRADRWHGALQVYNADGMRWSRPFPDKKEDVYRVMVVGDSLTYGDGLAEEWRFSNLLEQWLSRQFKIEVLNLGVDGFQSEDVLRATKKNLPLLNPELVIYAVCLNDFLPAGRGEYAYDFPFPLPATWKNFLMAHTRTGAFLSQHYDGALRRLHMRRDFFDDILSDFEGYGQRFARDVAALNAAVRSAGLPPLIAMVVDQYPLYGGRGYRIARIAEAALAQAGAQVIETESYYRRYHRQSMYISRWEGHPNEVANYIWASMIARELEPRPDLQPFKR